MAAEDCLLRTVCAPGDHVLIRHDAYGGTYRLFDKVLSRWQVSYRPVPLSRTPAPSGRPSRNARCVRCGWRRRPTRCCRVVDITALAQACREAGALLVVDNTFASPYLQNPLALGADVVVHSTTKYLGGHSDVRRRRGGGGRPGARRAPRFHAERDWRGGGPVRRLADAARDQDPRRSGWTGTARTPRGWPSMLATHPAVTAVLYPGLPGHPGHEVAAKQMRGFGGMVSFRVRGGEEAAVAVCGRTRLFTLGESLGGVESLIEHPARMTHASAAGSPLEVPGDLVRLSVGIESGDDLLEDLRRALGAGQRTMRHALRWPRPHDSVAGLGRRRRGPAG